MKNLVKELFAKYNIEANNEQLKKIELFYKMVIEENQKYNNRCTRILF